MKKQTFFSRLWSFLIKNWRLFTMFLTPVALLPLALVPGTDAAKCAYVIAIMGIFWVFEFVPQAVTSLIPVALFPLMGVMSTSDVSVQYFNNTIMLMVGSEYTIASIKHCFP
jgi:sodium-dependent dicarboxylate transporter 2/3/5